MSKIYIKTDKTTVTRINLDMGLRCSIPDSLGWAVVTAIGGEGREDEMIQHMQAEYGIEVIAKD